MELKPIQETKSPSSISPPPELEQKAKAELQGLAFSFDETPTKGQRGGRREGAGRKRKSQENTPEQIAKRDETIDEFLDANTLASVHAWLFRLVAHTHFVGATAWEPPQEPCQTLGKAANYILKKRLPDNIIENEAEISYGIALGTILISMFETGRREKQERAKQNSSGVRKEGVGKDSIRKDSSPATV